MKHVAAAVMLACGLFGAFVGSMRAEITPEQVRKAIDRGTAYILSQQRNDGSWPEWAANVGGISSLCTLALLNAGVEPDDQKIQKALSYLRTIKPERTYVVALQTMVFARAEPDKDRMLIGRNVRWLESTQITEGPNKGAWTYPSELIGSGGDNSNSQFALLALHEAERVGVVAGDRTWRLAKYHWEKCQNEDGSWGYNQMPPNIGTGSMTCAGISSLAIASDRIQSIDARVSGDQIDCCQSGGTEDSKRIEKAFEWLGRKYSIARNPNNEIWHLYYLYGLERAGRLTARRFIPLPQRAGQADRADWYREGAELLVRKQEGLSGFWTSVGHGEDEPLIGTSFALLFLSKGRWPVLIGKLQREGHDWNRHRADVGNLTRYIEKKWRRDMTWQVLDLRLAEVEDLAQTPVVYLCGSESPLPADPVERKKLAEKLRGYLDRGGFLFAEGYCGGSGFNDGFRKLMKDVFPEPEYKLQLLDAEHPIWYAEEKIDPKQLRLVYGVEFGCRTSVVYVPADPPQDPRPSLSCLWELSRPGRETKYSEAVQSQIDAALSLGVNVMAYATNRELKTKDEYFRPNIAKRPGDRIERGRLSVATLRHPGGCNAAPRAIANLMESAERDLKIRAQVREELLDINDEALFDFHLVFMHGRTAFRLTDAERQQLRQYVERGGMILADSICASRAFTESFRREMAAVFPDRKLDRITADDPLFGKTYGGFELQMVFRRDPETAAPGQPIEASARKVPPELEGIKLGDRWGVIFSQYDISCALEKRDSLECRGYTRDDAARLGLNIILYSLQQ
jgi:hypothetical protein